MSRAAQHRDLTQPWSEGDRPVPRRLVRPLQRFLRTEASSGALLLLAALAALVWANSSAAASYAGLWATRLSFQIGPLVMAEDLRGWINDLLMALFFFVAGMEIKRELVHGELRDAKAALLPVVCAAGGMAVPALLYLAVNVGGPGTPGWGIPMATDIAFAVGVLALAGRSVPAGLKAFLLTLAIADDIGAIVVIAIVYSQAVVLGWLALAGGTALAVAWLQRLQVRALVPYLCLAGVLWFALFQSGVHATIAGVALGLLTPAWPYHPPEAVTGAMAAELQALDVLRRAGRADEDEQSALMEISRLTQEAVSPLERLERTLHPWSSFIVLPVFALANAGVVLSGDLVAGIVSDPVTLGVIVGLVVGKPLGIIGTAYVLVRAGAARLPGGVSWPQFLGASVLAGIGFTVAIFVTGLAFVSGEAGARAKVGVLFASLLAGLIGSAILFAARPRAISGVREDGLAGGEDVAGVEAVLGR